MINNKLYQVLFEHHPFVHELIRIVSEEELTSFLNSRLQVISHPKKSRLLTAGEIPDKIFFMNEGMARGYFYDEKKNKETTLYLWDAGSFCTDVNHFITGQESVMNIEVFAGSQLLCLSKSCLQEVFEAFPGTDMFLKCLMLQEAGYLLTVSNDLMQLCAWERYLKMLKRYPGIELMVSKEVIASFLTITPQSLSRLIRENGHP